MSSFEGQGGEGAEEKVKKGKGHRSDIALTKDAATGAPATVELGAWEGTPTSISPRTAVIVGWLGR